jgi:hypothetical protein
MASKLLLKPSEARDVSFTITPEMLAHMAADIQMDPGYGKFTIQIAPNSADLGLAVDAEFTAE